MRSLIQIAAISCVAACAAFVTWKFHGPLNRAIPCDPALLKEGEICLATVSEKWSHNVLWIDARTKQDWQRDGVKGSLWITHIDGANFDTLLSEAAPRLVEGLPVIVYCSDAGCGTSLEVTKRIRDFQLAPEVHALHGGWKALKQAGLVEKSGQ